MKHRRMYFSNSFLDSFPTNAVTGMAASFYTNDLVINTTDVNNTPITQDSGFPSRKVHDHKMINTFQFNLKCVAVGSKAN